MELTGQEHNGLGKPDGNITESYNTKNKVLHWGRSPCKVRAQICPESCGCPLHGGAQGWVCWGSGQPDLVGYNQPMSGRWSWMGLRSLPTHSILWFEHNLSVVHGEELGVGQDAHTLLVRTSGGFWRSRAASKLDVTECHKWSNRANLSRGFSTKQIEAK